MMQSILSAILGLFFSVLVLGFLWAWFLGPLAKSINACCLKFVDSLSSTFSAGIMVGNKLIKTDSKNTIEADGVVTPGALLLETVAVPRYEIARWVTTLPVPKVGYVLFRGYSNHLERCLVINTTSLKKKFGRRVQLDNLDGFYDQDELSVVSTKTLEHVNALVAASISKIESKPAKAIKEVAIEKPVEAVPSSTEVSPDKTSLPEVKKDKSLEKYVGYLISYGKAIRHLSSQKNDASETEAGKEIEQFRIVIRSEDGVEESIWGQDLLRAIKDANVMVNDMVEVIKTGKRQFGSSFKNIYAVTKLA